MYVMWATRHMEKNCGSQVTTRAEKEKDEKILYVV